MIRFIDAGLMGRAFALVRRNGRRGLRSMSYRRACGRLQRACGTRQPARASPPRRCGGPDGAREYRRNPRVVLHSVSGSTNRSLSRAGAYTKLGARCARVSARRLRAKLFQRLSRFSLRFLRTQSLRSLCLSGERTPGCLGATATLAHMVERRRFRLGPRLIGAGEEELEIGASDNSARQATPPAGRSRPGRFHRSQAVRQKARPGSTPRRPGD